jgi:hypothetical protein
MSQPSTDTSEAPPVAERASAEVAERASAEVAERAAAAAMMSAAAGEKRLSSLLDFVARADKQVSNTSTTFAVAALAVCGLVLVLLPAIVVAAVGTTRFPTVDYLVTSLIGAVLLIGSVVGLVVDSRGRSGERKALYSTGADLVDRLDKAAANNTAAQLAAGGNG